MRAPGTQYNTLRKATLAFVNGLRRPTRRGLYGAARRAGASLLSSKFGMSAEQLADNVQALAQHHTPVDELESPTEAAESFVEAIADHEAALLASPKTSPTRPKR